MQVLPSPPIDGRVIVGEPFGAGRSVKEATGGGACAFDAEERRRGGDDDGGSKTPSKPSGVVGGLRVGNRAAELAC